MAAVAFTSGPNLNIVGNKRHITAVLTAPADGDTWATGLYNIDAVDISFNSATAAAADAVTWTKSGGTITFHVAGTARDLSLRVSGI